MHNKAPYDTLKSMAITSWQKELQGSYRNTGELLNDLGLHDYLNSYPSSGLSSFPFRVTPSFFQRMEKNNIDDPLLMQVLPSPRENTLTPGFSIDPVGDSSSQVTPGLLHKYQGRVLLIMTGACAIHCRYCFRQHFPYTESKLSAENRRAALTYIRNNRDVNEVILSGGDPLLLDNDKLEAILTDLGNISHVKRLRIHSRVPVVLPSRITPDFLDIFKNSRLKIVTVVHANHANEIDSEVGSCLINMHKAGMTLLSQIVLLKKINDKAEYLAELNEILFKYEVLPYYLHMLDRVRGSAHFLVEEEEAMFIVDALRRLAPGYLVPRLVKELSGAPYKVPLL